MDIYELVWRTEKDSIYLQHASANLQNLDLLVRTLINTAIALERPLLSSSIIKAFNRTAIIFLHSDAGEYREYAVEVGQHKSEEKDPRGNLPAYWRVPYLMDDLVNVVNRTWERSSAIELAAYVLWRINFIHPFRNGNGRTARALAYFILCVKYGGALPGQKAIPELITLNRQAYLQCLQKADKVYVEERKEDVSALAAYLEDLLTEQLQS